MKKRTWHERLKEAVDARGKKPADLVRITGRKASSVSAWFSGGSKMMEADNATQVCEYLRVKPMWLFFEKGPSGLASEPVLPALDRVTRDGYLRIDQLEVAGALGRGFAQTENPGVVQYLDVLEEWAFQQFGKRLRNIKVISGVGPSMKGTIENHDAVFVDSSVRQFIGDGIYVIAEGNFVRIKRLKRIIGNKLLVKSDNPDFGEEEIGADDEDRLAICGLVMESWTLKKHW